MFTQRHFFITVLIHTAGECINCMYTFSGLYALADSTYLLTGKTG